MACIGHRLKFAKMLSADLIEIGQLQPLSYRI